MQARYVSLRPVIGIVAAIAAWSPPRLACGVSISERKRVHQRRRRTRRLAAVEERDEPLERSGAPPVAGEVLKPREPSAAEKRAELAAHRAQLLLRERERQRRSGGPSRTPCCAGSAACARFRRRRGRRGHHCWYCARIVRAR